MSGKLILIVDDEKDFVKTTALRLGHEGYEIEEANDGTEALEKVAAKKPDLILLDIMMPGMTGTEVYEKLRAEPDTASIPIIFLTVWERLLPGTVEPDEGRYRFLMKPFDFQKLLQTIHDLIGGD